MTTTKKTESSTICEMVKIKPGSGPFNENCPICDQPARTTCRCRIGNMQCENHHHWFHCPIHRDVQIIGNPHDMGVMHGVCACESVQCAMCGQQFCEPGCPLKEPYELAVKSIGEGTVTADDLNCLMEALPKSAIERVHRRTRPPKVTPTQPVMADRVVPKRQGINNPPEQGRGKRYASGTPAKERQNQQQAIDKGGLREAKPVIYRKRLVEMIDQVCPHCDDVIQEKSLSYDTESKQWFHRGPCFDKGPITFAKETIEESKAPVVEGNTCPHCNKEMKVDDISFSEGKWYHRPTEGSVVLECGEVTFKKA